MSPTFSETLRAASMQAHEVANHSPYIEALLGGALSLDGFAALAGQHFFIYTALEEAAEAMRDDPVGGRFVFDELARVPALREDMAFFFGEDWRSVIEPNTATQAYCDRIREVAHDSPSGFVAHHYTRYLGDIAGGQVIRTKLKKFHGVTGPGSRFYAFDGIPSAPKFRDNYRELLNSAPWDAAERKRVIIETVRAYELNTAVFTALAERMTDYLVA